MQTPWSELKRGKDGEAQTAKHANKDKSSGRIQLSLAIRENKPQITSSNTHLLNRYFTLLL